MRTILPLQSCADNSHLPHAAEHLAQRGCVMVVNFLTINVLLTIAVLQATRSDREQEVWSFQEPCEICCEVMRGPFTHATSTRFDKIDNKYGPPLQRLEAG